MNPKDMARGLADHLAAYWPTYVAIFTAASLAGPLLGVLGEFPNPFKILACIVKDWIPWALLLAAGVVAIIFAMRVMNSRAGGDVLGMVFGLGLAILAAIYALDPAKMQSLVTALGGGAITFGSCT
ncbi:MAG: hypothetical protein M3Z04_14105 [Chloroflexota bacterium]|nr:hypothetical protein [Chloroflexota bacterium]